MRACVAIMGFWAAGLAQAQQTEPSPAESAAAILRRVEALADGPFAAHWDRIGELALLGAPAAPTVTQALENPHPAVRLAAAVTLCRMEEVTLDTFDVLLKLTRHERADVARTALHALERYGDLGEPDRYVQEIEQLGPSQDDPEREIDRTRALWELRLETTPEEVKRLEALTTHARPSVRYRAALALVDWDERRFDEFHALLRRAMLEPGELGLTALAVVRNHRLRGDPRSGPQAAATRRFVPEGLDFLQELVYLARRYYVEEGSVRDTKEIQEFDVDYRTHDLIAQGFMRALDPFSSVHSQEAQKRLDEDIRGAYGGIGAYVTDRSEWNDGKYVAISAPNYAGPAYAAGIRSRDEILGADGEWFEALTPFGEHAAYGGRLLTPFGQPYSDISPDAEAKGLQYVIKRLKGRPGTMVDILIRRRGWEEPRIVTVRRGTIRVPTVEYDLLPGGIGYLRLTQFGERSDEEMAEALKDLGQRGMTGILLDLRSNPGGQLPTVLRINSMFLPRGARISSARGRIEGWDQPRLGENIWNSTIKGLDLPMVCLIDGNSASGSEMTSAALRAHDRALIIGENTFGKGSGQRTYPVKDTKGTRILKLTIFKFYSPKEETIHVVGVPPHIELKPEPVIGKKAWVPFLIEERLRLLALRADDDFLDRHYAADKDHWAKLADHDGGSLEGYDGFEQWYATLGTRMSRDQARRFLRESGLRRVVADERGVKFIHNYLDDTVLQRGIVELVKKAGQDAAEIEAFQSFAKK